MKTSEKPSAAFKVGAISLAFFIVGYQSCLFMKKSAELAIEAAVVKPDTVVVYITPKIVRAPEPPDTEIVRTTPSRPASVERVAAKFRKVESFRFDPNTVSVAGLRRLGFSEKQALSIEAYRSRGGRFARPSDFAKSYVVADSVYERLRPFIDIPLLDINTADSADFDALPGIGPYYASAMVTYRSRLGGYSFAEQLMDIYRFDSLKFAGISDLICCSPPEPFMLWTLPDDSLRMHPYIKTRSAAHGIVIYRQNNPPARWTVSGLRDAGILPAPQAAALSRCLIGGGPDSDSIP